MSSLAMKTVVVTREPKQAKRFIDLLVLEKAVPISMPLIKVSAMRDISQESKVEQNLQVYDYMLFTSQNAVDHFDLWLKETGRTWDIRWGAFAVGEKTRLALEGKGLRNVVSPEKAHSADELCIEILGQGDMAGKRILFPKAKQVRGVLLENLRMAGIIVDEFIVYEATENRDIKDDLSMLIQGPVDWISFFSPSAVRSFFSLTGRQKSLDWVNLHQVKVACLGKITSAELRSFGCSPSVECTTPSEEEMIKCLKQWEGKIP